MDARFDESVKPVVVTMAHGQARRLRQVLGQTNAENREAYFYKCGADREDAHGAAAALGVLYDVLDDLLGN
jgi:hypothetical protein